MIDLMKDSKTEMDYYTLNNISNFRSKTSHHRYGLISRNFLSSKINN